MTGLDEWQRRSQPLTTVVPYVLLALLAALRVRTWLDLALCAGMALWILVFYTVHPAWRARRRVMGVFLTGLLVLTLILVIRDPWFGLYSPVCYFYAFRIIGWPAELFFVTGAAVVGGTAQATGVELSWGYAAVLLANVVPMAGLAWLGHVAERYDRERSAALADARAAQAENAALQQQLLAQARAAGVLDERQRMAREIHDTLAQGLIGIITQLQAAAHAADDAAGWRRHHDSATALARESLAEARRSVHELRPLPLETGRLADALAEVAERWSARHEVTVQVTTTGSVRSMKPAAEDALLRTAQEALANVARHAGATRVGITLSYLDRDVALDVRDDGRGFDPAAGAVTGFGLVAMRQRIEAMAGTLQIESEPGGGTGISACLPAVAS